MWRKQSSQIRPQGGEGGGAVQRGGLATGLHPYKIVLPPGRYEIYEKKTE